MLKTDDLLQNRYRIEDRLGEGGMGAVYRAQDEILSVTVAVKENLVVTDAAQRQFEREARLLASLRHANLPRVTDHFVIPGQGQYLVMDYIEGEDLAWRLLRHGRLPEAEVARWGGDVLDALGYLHARNIIHRDIKPANIKITPEGRAVLVDFGIAKFGGAGQTTTGARGLTPGYAPPEQYGIGSTDARSDLYALGATLYTALTGTPPTDALARMAQNQRLVPVAQLAAVSEQTAQALETALAMAPENRWPNAEAMRRALIAPTRPAAMATSIEPPTISPPELATQIELSNTLGPAQVPPSRPAPPLPPPPPSRPPSAVAGAVGTAPKPVTIPRPSRRMWIGVGVASLFGVGVIVILAVALIILYTNGGLPGAGGGGGAGAGLNPGTGKIAFVSDRDGNLEIYLAAIDGSSLENLTNDGAADFDPVFSPDGQQLAFTSDRGGNNDIYIMNADGSDVVNMTNNEADDNSPAWSPDGSKLAFSSDRDGNYEIYVGSEDGIVRYTHDPADDLMPAWSKNGDLVAFVSDRDGNYEIYVFGPDGLVRYTNTTANNGHPRWSPAANILAFESDRDGNYDIYLFDQDGITRYTDNPADEGEAAWSPDGSQLAFTSDRDGNPEIYILGPDGLQRLTDDGGEDRYPTWQPES